MFLLSILTKNNKKYIFRTFSLLFYLNNYSNIIYMERQKEMNIMLLLSRFRSFYGLKATDADVAEYLQRYRIVADCRDKVDYQSRSQKLCCLAHLQALPLDNPSLTDNLTVYHYRLRPSEELGHETGIYNLTRVFRPVQENDRFLSPHVNGEYHLDKLHKFGETEVDCLNDYCSLQKEVIVNYVDILAQIPDAWMEKAKGFLIELVDDKLFKKYPQVAVMNRFKVSVFSQKGLSGAWSLA